MHFPHTPLHFLKLSVVSIILFSTIHALEFSMETAIRSTERLGIRSILLGYYSSLYGGVPSANIGKIAFQKFGPGLELNSVTEIN